MFHPDRTYSLAELRDHSLANGYPAEAEACLRHLNARAAEANRRRWAEMTVRRTSLQRKGEAVFAALLERRARATQLENLENGPAQDAAATT